MEKIENWSTAFIHADSIYTYTYLLYDFRQINLHSPTLVQGDRNESKLDLNGLEPQNSGKEMQQFSTRTAAYVQIYKILHTRNSKQSAWHSLLLQDYSPWKYPDSDLLFSNSDTSSCSNFFDLVSDALNSTTSNPSSLQTRCAVVVFPVNSFTILNCSINKNNKITVCLLPSNDSVFQYVQ